MRRWVVLVCVWIGISSVVACGKKEEKKEPAKTAEPSPAPTPESREAEIRALVNRWVDVQNQGAFKEYEALYSLRFRGERPDGMFMRSYDRTAWMIERSQMAVAPTKLTISNVRVLPSLASIVVDFDQVYEHFEFSERGSKRLIFAREGTAWKISYDVPEPVRPYVETPGQNPANLAFVVYAASKSYVVLRKNAEPSWALSGAGTVENAGSVFIAVAPTGPGLPEEHRAFTGKAIEVLTPEGQRCQGKIGGLSLLTATDPPQPEIDLLNGKAGVPPKPDEAAHVFFKIARPQERLLVGELEGCQGSLAFTPGTKLSFKKVGPEIEIDHAALAKAVAGVPAVEELQAAFTHFYGGYPLRKDWFTEVKGYAIEGAPDLAIVVMHGSQEASDWYGSITVLVSGLSKKALRVIGASPFEQPPTMLLDIGEDGSFEVYSRAGEVFGDVVRPLRDKPVIISMMRPNLFN